MSAVTLVSGGLDSSLVAVMAKDEGLHQFPLFVDYGQKAGMREWEACKTVLRKHEIPLPKRMQIKGYGHTIKSGLTDPKKDVYKDAFLPGRNMMFLLCGAAYAVHR